MAAIKYKFCRISASDQTIKYSKYANPMFSEAMILMKVLSVVGESPIRIKEVNFILNLFLSLYSPKWQHFKIDNKQLITSKCVNHRYHLRMAKNLLLGNYSKHTMAVCNIHTCLQNMLFRVDLHCPECHSWQYSPRRFTVRSTQAKVGTS